MLLNLLLIFSIFWFYLKYLSDYPCIFTYFWLCLFEFLQVGYVEWNCCFVCLCSSVVSIAKLPSQVTLISPAMFHCLHVTASCETSDIHVFDSLTDVKGHLLWFACSWLLFRFPFLWIVCSQPLPIFLLGCCLFLTAMKEFIRYSQ